MPQVQLTPPQYHSQPLNTGDSSERGVTPKGLIEAVNAMMTELYATVAGQEQSILQLKSFTVATQPDPTASAGQMIYVSDGANGAAIAAFSDGAAWLRCDDRTEITAEPAA